MELNEKNYYSVEANMEYMSVSEYKDFAKCEFYGLMKAKGEWVEKKSPALLQGGYIDAHFSNRLENYKLENPDLFKKDGTLLQKYEDVNTYIKVAEEDEFFMGHINNGKTKTQFIATGTIKGVKWKGCFDFLNTRIIDLKLVASIRELVWKYDPLTNRNYQTNFISAYGYVEQGCIYQELGRQMLGVKLPFDIAAISKEEEPDKAIINIDDDILAEKLEEVSERAIRYDLIKKGIIEPTKCGNCPCCRKYNKLNRVIGYRELFNIGEEE